MGRYIDSEKVIVRYGELDDVSSGGLFSTLDSHYIVYAEAELDSRLASAFTVPFSSNNLTAQDLSIDLTYLKAASLTQQEAEMLTERIDFKIDQLLKGRSKMLTITDSGTAEVGDSRDAVAWSDTKDYHPVFGIGSILDFAVDSSRIEDEQDERD